METSSAPRATAPGQAAVRCPIDWPAVLAEHDRWLRTIVYARVRDGHAVEEIMQEVAMAAVRQSAPLNDATKVAPWLYRLAVTQSLLYRRKMGRRRKLMDRFTNDTSPVDHDRHTPEPLDWLLADERQRMVRVAMGRLARRDAELLLLKYTENWSYQQIAKHLGVTDTAVEARLHRARARLREELTALNVAPAA